MGSEVLTSLCRFQWKHIAMLINYIFNNFSHSPTVITPENSDERRGVIVTLAWCSNTSCTESTVMSLCISMDCEDNRNLSSSAVSKTSEVETHKNAVKEIFLHNNVPSMVSEHFFDSIDSHESLYDVVRTLATRGRKWVAYSPRSHMPMWLLSPCVWCAGSQLLSSVGLTHCTCAMYWSLHLYNILYCTLYWTLWCALHWTMHISPSAISGTSSHRAYTAQNPAMQHPCPALCYYSDSVTQLPHLVSIHFSVDVLLCSVVYWNITVQQNDRKMHFARTGLYFKCVI